MYVQGNSPSGPVPSDCVPLASQWGRGFPHSSFHSVLVPRINFDRARSPTQTTQTLHQTISASNGTLSQENLGVCLYLRPCPDSPPA